MRREAAAVRKQLAAESPDADSALARHANAIIRLAGGGAVAGYLPIRSELSPLPLIAALAGRGVVTAMPMTPPRAALLPWRLPDRYQGGLYVMWASGFAIRLSGEQDIHNRRAGIKECGNKRMAGRRRQPGQPLVASSSVT